MRKWMRDKLKRRKKAEESPAGQPAPLQPAYFDAEQQPQVTALPGRAEEEFQPATEPLEVETGGTGEGGEGEVPAPEGAAPEAVADTRRPRRRRRGGRG